MVAVLEKATTVYKKGQTTLPAEVRTVLGVGPGDSVTFVVDGDGTVLVQKTAQETREDPALAPFLSFLAADMHDRPTAIASLTEGLEARLRELTRGAKIDRDRDRITGDVGL